jgi:hypothetical protein
VNLADYVIHFINEKHQPAVSRLQEPLLHNLKAIRSGEAAHWAARDQVIGAKVPD